MPGGNDGQNTVPVVSRPGKRRREDTGHSGTLVKYVPNRSEPENQTHVLDYNEQSICNDKQPKHTMSPCFSFNSEKLLS